MVKSPALYIYSFKQVKWKKQLRSKKNDDGLIQKVTREIEKGTSYKMRERKTRQLLYLKNKQENHYSYNISKTSFLVKSKVTFRRHSEFICPVRDNSLTCLYYLLNEELCWHLSLNTDTIKNYVKEISQTLCKKLWRFCKNFLRFRNDNKNMFVNTSDENCFLFF